MGLTVTRPRSDRSEDIAEPANPDAVTKAAGRQRQSNPRWLCIERPTTSRTRASSAECQAGFKCETPSSRAISTATEVISTSRSPHGTIDSKPTRSIVTFSAKPWKVTQRRTPTPIEANLRSRPELSDCPTGSTKTPVQPGTRREARPSSSSAAINPASRFRKWPCTSRRPSSSRSMMG